MRRRESLSGWRNRAARTGIAAAKYVQERLVQVGLGVGENSCCAAHGEKLLVQNFAWARGPSAVMKIGVGPAGGIERNEEWEGREARV
jgi:hypothetical protein